MARKRQTYRWQPSPVVFTFAALLVTIALILGGCTSADGPSGISASGPDTEVDAAAAEAPSAETSTYSAIEPLSPEEALPPVSISIPDATLQGPVDAMGWTVVEEDGLRTTRWVVPDGAAGWHINSAGAGAAGNMILSGHQLQGEGLFAPLSLGDVAIGQEVFIVDEAGTTFVYRIGAVSDPIPVTGASEDDEAQALTFVDKSDGALLTLITGWPEFTTTHRVFAQAELLGIQE